LVCRIWNGSRRCKIIPLVAGGLRVMSGNRALKRTFPQVNAIIPESCRLFSEARMGAVFGKIASEPDCSTSDYSFQAFPQVGSAAEQYQRLLPARGGTVAVPPPVLRWYCDFGRFSTVKNNRKPRSKPGLVLRKMSYFITEWE
jgi:hypothetical protein